MNATTLTSVTVTKDSPGAGQVTIVANYETHAFTQPAKQTTIGDFPTGNGSWSRSLRLTDQGFLVLRNGVTPFGILTAVLSKIAYTVVGALTWAPRITTQPVAASCVASSTAANFAVVANVNDEVAPTYQWQYETKAAGTIVTSGTELADGDTVTINGQAYRFKDTPAQAYDVKRNGTTAATTLENLIKAINATGTPGSEYFTGTLVHPTVQADAALTVTSTTLTLRARTSGTAGNALTLAKSSAQLTVSGAVLSGGGTWNSATGTVLGCAYTNGTTATLTCTPTTTAQSGTNHRCALTNPAATTNSSSVALTIT